MITRSEILEIFDRMSADELSMIIAAGGPVAVPKNLKWRDQRILAALKTIDLERLPRFKQPRFLQFLSNG